MPDIDAVTVIAAELVVMRETAVQYGFPFLAYLIDMARMEAERHSAAADFEI